MPFWYFFRVPKLPHEVAHQSGTVDIQKYLISEGQRVGIGTPIALVENYWAVMQINANGNGILKRTFFDAGSSVQYDDPIAIIICDGEDVPPRDSQATLKVIRMKRTKPSTTSARASK